MPVPIPENEVERLQLLEQLDLLDDLSTESYNFVTNVAATVFDVPMSLITILTEDWQYFLSQVGSNDDGTSREHAFCAYNIMDPELMVVEDATKDDRFKDNPYVVDDPKIRFYAGSPIHAGDDLYLGSVCIVDTKPRTLSEDQKKILESLGRQVSGLIQMKKLTRQLRLQTQEVHDLRRILPRCSRCGDIRNDSDYWTTVDEYLSQHTHAEVSDAICPSCTDDLDKDLDLV